MSDYNPVEHRDTSGDGAGELPIIIPEVVAEPLQQPVILPQRRRRRVLLPLLLFIATCLSTLYAGFDQVELPNQPQSETAALATAWLQALRYAVPLMIILICHEMGHFIQTRRYGVYSSYPYFIPMPLTLLGTMGAVIAMEARMGHRRALFDIGITGPLAGLIPTIIFCIIGLHISQPVPFIPKPDSIMVGAPVLFQLIKHWMHPSIPEGFVLNLDPMAFAGWVGLLITSLNLMPIGQLDGGHILYALLRKNARRIATLFLLAAIAAALWQSWVLRIPSPWTLMLFLLLMMGPAHPPTADDYEPLGLGRCILGWLTLAFILVGFTPNPLLFGS
jgi:membrane-associated protease RseP (regulator of RpoE activity)